MSFVFWAEPHDTHTEEMRNPRKALKRLGLANHPRVVTLCNILNAGVSHRGHSASALWPGIRDIICRLSGHDQYRSTKEVTTAQTAQMKEENKLRQKAKKVEPPNRTLSREVNVHEAMSSHLIHECKSHGNGFVFSLKASSHPDSNFQVTVASLEDHIHTTLGNAIQRIPVIQPAAKRHHMDVEAQLEEAFDDDLTPRGDDDLEVAHEQVDVHFKVVYTCGGSMKLPMYPIASGRRLQQMDIVVSMHPVISHLGEEVSTLNRPQHIAGYSPSQLGVLTLTDSDVEHLRSYSRRWTKGKGRFTWANIAATLDVIETVTRFV